jgi:hypothetical protein
MNARSNNRHLALRYLAVLGTIIATLFAVSSCMGKRTQSKEMGQVVSRIPSMNSTVDAVVTKHMVRGSKESAYSLYVVWHGERPERDECFLSAEEMEGLKIYWVTNHRLLVRYSRAYIKDFRSHWVLPRSQSNPASDLVYPIQAELAPVDLIPDSRLHQLLHEKIVQ